MFVALQNMYLGVPMLAIDLLVGVPGGKGNLCGRFCYVGGA